MSSGRPLRDSGTALIEMTVAGLVAVMVLLPTVHALATLSDARARASVVAHDTAALVARHGSVPENHGSVVDDDIATEVVIAESMVEATSRVDVVLLSVGGAEVRVSVTERARTLISPYRSGP